MDDKQLPLVSFLDKTQPFLKIFKGISSMKLPQHQTKAKLLADSHRSVGTLKSLCTFFLPPPVSLSNLSSLNLT
jgi:hypothetical protein